MLDGGVESARHLQNNSSSSVLSSEDSSSNQLSSNIKNPQNNSLRSRNDLHQVLDFSSQIVMA